MGKNEAESSPWSQSPAELLVADENFSLADFDCSATPGWEGSKEDAKKYVAERANLLAELQERLYAEGRNGGNRKILLVVQGLDTAGKGGVARHVLSLVDPQGVDLHSFGVPTKEELSHHYLWRIKKALPPAGKIGLFDRSHYEDVLVVRVDRLVPKNKWEKRYEEINRFEKRVANSGTTIIKVALMVSHEEQGIRLMERLDRPDKFWKYNPGDVDTREKWDQYQQAYSDVFTRTSTAHAPWFVIPADHKWYARLAITELLLQALIDMDLRWPTPTWRRASQKRRLAATMSAQALAKAKENAEEKAIQVPEETADFHRAVQAADMAGPAEAGEELAAQAEGESAPRQDDSPASDADKKSKGKKSASKKKGKKSKKGKGKDGKSKKDKKSKKSKK